MSSWWKGEYSPWWQQIGSWAFRRFSVYFGEGLSGLADAYMKFSKWFPTDIKIPDVWISSTRSIWHSIVSWDSSRLSFDLPVHKARELTNGGVCRTPIWGRQRFCLCFVNGLGEIMPIELSVHTTEPWFWNSSDKKFLHKKLPVRKKEWHYISRGIEMLHNES